MQEEQHQQNETATDQAITEELNFNKPDFQFVPNDTHTWKQQGPYVVCKTCGLEHATYIGMDKLMTGINASGLPVLSERR